MKGSAAAGLMPRQLESAIATALKTGEILVNPVVKVTVVEYHSRPIAVMGAVRKPLTFQAGGHSETARRVGSGGGSLGPSRGHGHHGSGSRGETHHITVKALMKACGSGGRTWC